MLTGQTPSEELGEATDKAVVEKGLLLQKVI